MRALQMLSRTQEVVANNLANLNTAGFKKDKLFFHALQNKLHGKQINDPQADQILNMQAGEYKQTGNPFDFAIEGEGFFQVEHEGQMMLTRSGRFHLDREGYLRDSNNGFVQGANGRVYIPQFYEFNSRNEEVNIQVAKDGTIRLNDEAVDKIRMVKVDNLQNLERRTNSYLALTNGASPVADTTSTISQGFFETGNINPLEEMSNMVTTMRLFESQQRVMTTSDDLLRKATSSLGKI
jgi:flagellar basal-body rod protein FlgF/flagellar basal-body rod protein FlgG